MDQIQRTREERLLESINMDRHNTIHKKSNRFSPKNQGTLLFVDVLKLSSHSYCGYMNKSKTNTYWTHELHHLAHGENTYMRMRIWETALICKHSHLRRTGKLFPSINKTLLILRHYGINCQQYLLTYFIKSSGLWELEVFKLEITMSCAAQQTVVQIRECLQWVQIGECAKMIRVRSAAELYGYHLA